MLAHGHGPRVRVGLFGFFLSVLAGCSAEPPGCADPKTLALVKETFWSTVAKDAVNPDEKSFVATVRPKFDVSVDLPRVSEKHSDAAKVFCVGTLKVAMTAAVASTVDKMFRRESTAAIEYSSQITADGKEHVVELAGHETPVEYVWSVAKMGAFNPPATAGSAQTPSPEQPPQAAASVVPAPQTPGPASSEARAASLPADADAAEQEFRAADKALNDAYQAARGVLPDQQKIALRDEQREWIKQRDATCPAGSGAPDCKTRLTVARTKQLQALAR